MTYRWECCSTDAISSTARALDMAASPGRVTVHCSSRVRSERDFGVRPRQGAYIGGRNDILAKVAAQVGSAGAPDAVAHDHEGVEPQGYIDQQAVVARGQEGWKPPRLSGIR